MNSRFRKLRIESLEGRSVLSTMHQADFNGDSYQDLAELTGPNTITVSLFNSETGGYDVSAILKAPKSETIGDFSVDDTNGDGIPDISTGGIANNRFYSITWLGNGDGTFSSRDVQRLPKIRPGW